jgi:predicted porin
MSKHRIILSLALVFGLAFDGCHGSSKDISSSEDDVQLLNEIVSEKLRNAGVDTNFSFSGNSFITCCAVNQTVKGDKAPETFSYQGNIYLRYDNKAPGFGYGFEIGTKQKSGLMKQGNPICDSSFLYFELDNVGKIKIGYNGTAADAFCIRGDSILVGYQGPGSGDFAAFYNVSAGAIIDGGFFADDGKALKICWTSPTISGVSLGVSYTLDSRSANLFRTKKSVFNPSMIDGWDFARTTAFSKNIITGGISYERGSPEDFNMKMSLVGWFGRGVPCRNFTCSGIKNIRAYNLGLILGYKDFKISLGFLDGGQSLLCKRFAVGDDVVPFDPEAAYSMTSPEIGIKEGADAGKCYNIGLSYKWEKLTLSAGYFRSSTKFSRRSDEKATADIITLAAEYTFNKAVSVYVEYNNIKTETCDRAMKYKKACGLICNPNNRASIFMVGTCINF